MKLSVTFDKESSRLIEQCLNDFRREIKKASLTLDSRYLRIILSSLRHLLRFHSYREALREESNVVMPQHVKKVLNRAVFLKEDVNTLVRRLYNQQKVILKMLDELYGILVENLIILDAGCGWGRLPIEIKSLEGNAEGIVGIDLDMTSLSYVKSEIPEGNFVRADICFLPIRAKSLAAIVNIAVIHEINTIEGREKAIEEFSRVLRKAGHLYLIDTFSTRKFFEVIRRLLRKISRKYEWYWSVNHMIRCLQKSNFEVLTISRIGKATPTRATYFILSKLRD